MFKYYYFTVLDLLLGYPSYDALRVKSGLSKFNILRRNRKTKDRIKYTVATSISEDYFFFPLQVTNDAQILINSDYDNVSAMKFYADLAKKMSLKLVVKIHPAERNTNFISMIQSLALNDGILLSENNTFELISNAKVVGVNNSTVGFESLLCGKKTFFIGRTYYKKLEDLRWRKYYIDEYLVKIDSFTGIVSEANIIKKIDFLVNFKISGK